MAITRINGSNNNELYARHINMVRSSGTDVATIVSSDWFQQYLVFTQRCGVFAVWNANGTHRVVALSSVNNLTFEASGSKNLKVTWNSTDNLHLTVLSYAPFEITV